MKVHTGKFTVLSKNTTMKMRTAEHFLCCCSTQLTIHCIGWASESHKNILLKNIFQYSDHLSWGWSEGSVLGRERSSRKLTKLPILTFQYFYKVKSETFCNSDVQGRESSSRSRTKLLYHLKHSNTNIFNTINTVQLSSLHNDFNMPPWPSRAQCALHTPCSLQNHHCWINNPWDETKCWRKCMFWVVFWKIKRCLKDVSIPA